MADLPKLPIYEGWRNVPSGLFTKSQLAELDLPRVPGPQRSWVKTSNWRDKADHFALFALSEAPPSPASAARLQAVRARSVDLGVGGRVCEGCGARPDRPVPELGHVPGSGHLPEMPSDRWADRRLCLACARVLRIRAALAMAAVDRDEAAEWAADTLTTRPLVVRCAEVLRPPAPSGRRNLDPVALRVDAVDADGDRLVLATLRLAGPRVKAVPDDAVDPATVADRIRPLLAAPVVVTWRDSELLPLARLYGTASDPMRLPYGHTSLRQRATSWRGEIDPDTLEARAAIDPLTADRTQLLLRRMAATVRPTP